ncbi:MAG: RsmB/NOP family class I SAM-dependent RNA methyltransferase [Enterocloster sp.]
MTDINQLPEAFLREMKDLLGQEYDSYTESFQEEWKPGLRTNRLKLSPEELAALLPWKLMPVPWTENGFYYDEKEFLPETEGPAPAKFLRPSKHPCYYAGLYYLQEPSAMTPAAMLPVEPGERVLDLCAAPGGKSTELAGKLNGTGMLVSNDISYSRARALLKNLEMTGAPNVCVVSEDPRKLAEAWPEFFDKILVDAPCSGEGMFRRDDDMVRDWTEHGPSYYGPLQRQILEQAVKMLKPGGMLLYSTCTFSKYEDEESVKHILDNDSQMELVPLDPASVPGSSEGIGLSGCMRLFPHKVQGEGHFLALMRKKKTQKISCLRQIPENTAKRRQSALEKETELLAFLKLCRISWQTERIVIHKDSVYYLPEDLEWNLPLRFLRTGLLLGELKKGRFEPSQALSMALKKGQYPTVLDLKRGDDRVIRYLKGETLSLEEAEGPVKGWCLVSYEGYSLGWAKGVGMNLKNKYYPGWRWQ